MPINPAPYVIRTPEIIALRKKLADRLATRNYANFARHISGNSQTAAGEGPYGGVGILGNNGGNAAPATNNDETTVDLFAGNFTKGLNHDPTTGYVAQDADYEAFVNSLNAARAHVNFPATSDLFEVVDAGFKSAIADPAERRSLVNHACPFSSGCR